MEADWEIEIGPGAPVIEANWTGFVDLRRFPQSIAQIDEALRLPALASALLQINGEVPAVHSLANLTPMWTSKCDLWTAEHGNELDPFELDADPSDAQAGLRCYIDLLPREESVFASVSAAEIWAKLTVKCLSNSPTRNCRVDLVVRQAFADQAEGSGITAYLTGCGSDIAMAEVSLTKALQVFAEILCPPAP